MTAARTPTVVAARLSGIVSDGTDGFFSSGSITVTPREFG